MAGALYCSRAQGPAHQVQSSPNRHVRRPGRPDVVGTRHRRLVLGHITSDNHIIIASLTGRVNIARAALHGSLRRLSSENTIRHIRNNTVGPSARLDHFRGHISLNTSIGGQLTRLTVSRVYRGHIVFVSNNSAGCLTTRTFPHS